MYVRKRDFCLKIRVLIITTTTITKKKNVIKVLKIKGRKNVSACIELYTRKHLENKY